MGPLDEVGGGRGDAEEMTLPVSDDTVNRWEEATDFAPQWSDEPTFSGWIPPREVIGNVTQVFARHGSVLVGLACVVGALEQALTALMSGVPGASMATSRAGDMLPMVMNFFLTLPHIVLLFVLSGALSIVSLATHHGRVVTVGSALRLTLPRAGRLVGGGIVVGMGVGLLQWWPTSFYATFTRANTAGMPSPDPGMGLIVYGFVVFVVLCFLAVRLCFVGPIAVLEEGIDPVAGGWHISGRYWVTLSLTMIIPALLIAVASAALVSFAHGLVGDIASLLLLTALPLLPICAGVEVYLLARKSIAETAAPPMLDYLPLPEVEAVAATDESLAVIDEAPVDSIVSGEQEVDGASPPVQSAHLGSTTEPASPASEATPTDADAASAGADGTRAPASLMESAAVPPPAPLPPTLLTDGSDHGPREPMIELSDWMQSLHDNQAWMRQAALRQAPPPESGA